MTPEQRPQIVILAMALCAIFIVFVMALCVIVIVSPRPKGRGCVLYIRVLWQLWTVYIGLGYNYYACLLSVLCVQWYNEITE